MSANTFIDFKAVKEQVSIEKAVSLLGLVMTKKGDQLRSACPACKSGGDRMLTVNLNKSAFYCFVERKGGDEIGFVNHVRGLNPREAADFLTGTVRSPTVPRSARPPTPAGPKRSFDPEAYAKG